MEKGREKVKGRGEEREVWMSKKKKRRRKRKKRKK